VNALDSQGLIRHRLFQDHTNYDLPNWSFCCKDLERLQRDPKRIIVIDHDHGLYCKMKENLLNVKPFETNQLGQQTQNDEELLKFIPLLESKQKKKHTN
jgi:hypothetical protein